MPNGPPPSRRRLVSVALSLGIVIAGFYILSRGENFFVPLIIAFIAVYLVAILEGLIRRFQIGEWRVPKFLSVILSFAIIFGLGYGFIAVVANNASHIAAAAPRYQVRFQHLQAELSARAGIQESPEFQQLVRGIDLRPVFTTVAKGLAGLVENITLVFIYGLFIMLELRFVPVKFKSLFPDPSRRQRAATIFRRIDKEIHTYLGVKTAVSFTTALLSYLLMRLVGLDFAEFWALLIFVLHFIPTVGVIVGTLLPTILAAVQFQSLGPVLGIGVGLTATAQLMGSIVEPNLMGETLNLSPLAVIMALIFWGTLWGITGAFLCVPLTVILVIVMSNFDSTRWIAVLLSKTGVLRLAPKDGETGEEGSENGEVGSEDGEVGGER
jgi:predicted PurR-regulated permease PerM